MQDLLKTVQGRMTEFKNADVFNAKAVGDAFLDSVHELLKAIVAKLDEHDTAIGDIDIGLAEHEAAAEGPQPNRAPAPPAAELVDPEKFTPAQARDAGAAAKAAGQHAGICPLIEKNNWLGYLRRCWAAGYLGKPLPVDDVTEATG